MKFKTTIKALKEHAKKYKFYSVPYCGLQHALYFFEPIAYNVGKHGWNFDVYNVGGLYIATGYSYMPGERMQDYKILDGIAKNVVDLYRKGLITFEEGQKLVKIEIYKHLRESED